MTPQSDPAATSEGTRTSRPRDSAASKEALFEAARNLFGQKGFERTTLREIGEAAGVDAALIARYFGSKADLYIAVLSVDRMGAHEGSAALDVEPYSSLAQIADVVLSRSDEHGLGPIVQALIRADTSEEIRQAARERLARRLVDPICDGAPADIDDAALKAQLAISALLGISAARALGWFDELQAAPRDQVVQLLCDAIGAIMGEEPAAGSD